MVIGDVIGAEGLAPGVELWRTDFIGWDVGHRFRAESRCTPRRYSVVEAGHFLATGRTDSPYLMPGDTFRIAVNKPPGDK